MTRPPMNLCFASRLEVLQTQARHGGRRELTSALQPSHLNSLMRSQSYCKFCRDIVDRLDDANAPVKEVALDSYGESLQRHSRGHEALIIKPIESTALTMQVHGQVDVDARVITRVVVRLCPTPVIAPADNGNHVRDQLRASTGQEHVPYVYIGGKLIVSEDAALALKAPGTKMKEMLEGVGVKATGYFRT